MSRSRKTRGGKWKAGCQRRVGNINLLLVGVGQEVQQEQLKLVKKCLQLNQKEGEGLKIIRKLGVDEEEMAKIEESDK